MDTQQLVLAARQHDEDAIAQLYTTYYKAVLSVAYSGIKNEDDAQDIAQEAFITAFEKLDELKDPTQFKAWVCKIATFKVMNLRKKSKPVLIAPVADEADESGDWITQDTFVNENEEFIPGAEFDRQETSAMLEKMFFSLPEEQRMCFVMYAKEGMSVAQIAEALGVQPDTVYSRLRYARKKIQQNAAEEEKRTGVRLYSGIPFVLWALAEVIGKNSIPPLSFTTANPAPVQQALAAGARKGAAVAGKKAVGAAAKTGLTLLQKALIAVASVGVVSGGLVAVTQLANAQPSPDLTQEVSSSVVENVGNSASGQTELSESEEEPKPVENDYSDVIPFIVMTSDNALLVEPNYVNPQFPQMRSTWPSNTNTVQIEVQSPINSYTAMICTSPLPDNMEYRIYVEPVETTTQTSFLTYDTKPETDSFGDYLLLYLDFESTMTNPGTNPFLTDGCYPGLDEKLKAGYAILVSSTDDFYIVIRDETGKEVYRWTVEI